MAYAFWSGVGCGAILAFVVCGWHKGRQKKRARDEDLRKASRRELEQVKDRALNLFHRAVAGAFGIVGLMGVIGSSGDLSCVRTLPAAVTAGTGSGTGIPVVMTCEQAPSRGFNQWLVWGLTVLVVALVYPTWRAFQRSDEAQRELMHRDRESRPNTDGGRTE